MPATPIPDEIACMDVCREDDDCRGAFVKDNLCHIVPLAYQYEIEQDDGTDYFKLIEEKNFETEAILQKGDFHCLEESISTGSGRTCGFPYFYKGAKLFACRDGCQAYR